MILPVVFGYTYFAGSIWNASGVVVTSYLPKVGPRVRFPAGVLENEKPFCFFPNGHIIALSGWQAATVQSWPFWATFVYCIFIFIHIVVFKRPFRKDILGAQVNAILRDIDISPSF